MTEEMMSLDEVAKECKEAAEYLASQPGEGYDLDTLMRDKSLEFEESLSKAEKRLIRANEIENLECLAAHLERLPRHCFHGNQMTGFGNYISAIIYDAVEVLKDNS